MTAAMAATAGAGEEDEGRGGRIPLLVALSHSTIDHASPPRRRTSPPRNRDTSNSWGLIAFLPIQVHT